MSRRVPEHLTFPHILSGAQFTPELMRLIISRTGDMRVAMRETSGRTHRWPREITGKDGITYPCHLEGFKVVFEQGENSSRTFGSLMSATVNMGGVIIPFPKDNSLSKGESFVSHYSMMAGDHPAVVVIRCSENLRPHRAAWLFESYSGTVPGKDRYGACFNAGDGTGEHPTQAVNDMVIIYETLGRIDDFTMLITGDLGWSRTINSLLLLISNVCRNVRIKFAVPVVDGINYGPPPAYLQELTAAGVPYETILVKSHAEFKRILRDHNHAIDVIYTTRPQKERYIAAGVADPDQMVIDITQRIEMTKEEFDIGIPVFHPLPHSGEIRDDCDRHPKNLSFRQANNGTVVRMALFQLALLDLPLMQSMGRPVPDFPLGWAAI